MRFVTETGSVYELDTFGKRIRRLRGTDKATSRQGDDGNWKPFAGIEFHVGEPCLILWPEGTPLLPGSPPGAAPATLTSRVVEIDYDV